MPRPWRREVATDSEKEFIMPEGENTKTPETGDNTQQQASQSTGQQPGPGEGKQPPWGKPENFDAEQAWELIQNLRKEKGVDDGESKKLAEELNALKKSQADQRDAFAKALGLKPEETSDSDKLAHQLQEIKQQMAESQRKATLLEVAAAPGVDDEGNPLPSIPKEYHHLLTATETEALQAQAKSVAALVAAQAKQNGSPGFAPPAGQGQGNTGKAPSLHDQIAAAETAMAGKERGTPEWRVAQQKVVDLKGQLLAEQHTKIR